MKDFDESLVDWAREMVEAGYESDNLYLLASKTAPALYFGSTAAPAASTAYTASRFMKW